MALTFVGQAVLVAAAWFWLTWSWFVVVLLLILVLGDAPLVIALRRHAPHHTGPEALPGRNVVLATRFEPARGGWWQAKVRLDGELWSAWSDEPRVAELTPGAPLRVEAVEGLRLLVSLAP